VRVRKKKDPLDDIRSNEDNEGVRSPRQTVSSGRNKCPEEALYLELVRTTELLSRPFLELMKAEEISPAQYNVLRILRGAPDGLTCGEIGNRMISRDPDITRLLDRLEKRALVCRSRDDKDRRVVLTRISPQGLDLLDRLDEPVCETHRRLLGHLGPQRMAALSEMLAACREHLS
jgi:DNA-binding MarR family transcriptional regulator